MFFSYANKHVSISGCCLFDQWTFIKYAEIYTELTIEHANDVLYFPSLCI